MRQPILISTLLLSSVFLSFDSHAQTNVTPPQIQNIHVAQRSGAMFVDITYDLVEPDCTNTYVIAEFSSDGGTTYGLPIFSLSGDIGPVRPGSNRHIVWNAWNDWAGNYTTNGKIRLTADATTCALPTPPTNAPGPNLVWIPSGTFNMERLNPSRNVYISRGFWMGRFEVTQGEYVAVMTNNPSYETWSANLPVEAVTSAQAAQYCQLLTDRERVAGRIGTNWTYRLPTEAEWEYACRAGTTTDFPYGNDPNYVRLQAYAWYSANSSGGTQPVGSKVPNQWGLFDMMGNVREWCSDGPCELTAGNFTDPQSGGGGCGTGRVVRGAAYDYSAGAFPYVRENGFCNPTYLNWVDCASRNTGFRVVLAPTL